LPKLKCLDDSTAKESKAMSTIDKALAALTPIPTEHLRSADRKKLLEISEQLARWTREVDTELRLRQSGMPAPHLQACVRSFG
jgi:hypothetical protein